MESHQVVLSRISGEAGVRPNQVEATIALLEQQSTGAVSLPDIARKRRVTWMKFKFEPFRNVTRITRNCCPGEKQFSNRSKSKGN